MRHIGVKLATLGLFFASAVSAKMQQGQMHGQMQQHGRMTMGSPNYDTTTETALKGTIEAVKQVEGPQGWGGTHLTVRTNNEMIDIHVGPSWFLSQHKMNFANGDKVEITGSRAKFGNEDALLARKIKRGDQTLTLRNPQGIPAWAGRGRGQ